MLKQKSEVHISTRSWLVHIIHADIIEKMIHVKMDRHSLSYTLGQSIYSSLLPPRFDEIASFRHLT